MSRVDLDYATAWRWLLPAFPGTVFLGDAAAEAWFRELLPAELEADPSWALIDARALANCDHLPSALVRGEVRQAALFGPSRSVAKAMKRLDLTGLRKREYGLIPARSPRVVVPLASAESARGALRLHTPGSLLGKLAVRALRWLTRLGVVWPLRRSRLVIVERGDCSPWALRNLSASSFDGCDFALYLGAKGAERKTVALPMGATQRRAVPAIVKTAETPLARRKLVNEARMLSFLATTRLAAQVPTRLSFQALGSVSVLVQQRFEAGRPGRAALDVAVQRFLLTALEIRRAPVPLHQHLMAARARPGASSHDDARELLLRALGVRFAMAVLPSALTHGDFAPWNLGMVGGSLVVYDWEEGAEDGVPMNDAFSYVIFPEVLIARQRDPVALVTKAIAFADQTYAAAGVSQETVRAALALWCLTRGESFFPHVLNHAAKVIIDDH